MKSHPVLVAGQWRDASPAGTFHTEKTPADPYPASAWADIDAALLAAAQAAVALRQAPPESLARFLRAYADLIESRKSEIVDLAAAETALPKSPRLADVELPRTTHQLRLAADAALEGSWALPTIDTRLNIRSRHAAIGPVCIFGPNNFPLAFNAVSGGDFAAAIAAGNPVIAKAHPGHPGTTRLLAEQAFAALAQTDLPPATLQFVYHVEVSVGLRLVADPRLGATAFTGSRGSGLKLKSAADGAGKPIYLEMSSINPVVILPGALRQRAEKIADEFTESCLAATGQFCTNPGLVILLAGPETESFVAEVARRFSSRSPGPMLSSAVGAALRTSVHLLVSAGAQVVAGNTPSEAGLANTLLRVDGRGFLRAPHALQQEAFGNASLLVVAADAVQARSILEHLDGNLTGSIYSDTLGSDDATYAELALTLRRRVGRLLNDKMPTGVAVSPAMNHGGPYPSTGHPGFTAVGIPASLRRFSMLECYDNVRPARLPSALADKNPNGKMWRLIDGAWTQADAARG